MCVCDVVAAVVAVVAVVLGCTWDWHVLNAVACARTSCTITFTIIPLYTSSITPHYTTHTTLSQVEGEIGEQIALANFKISDLKSRLVHTAAEIEHIVNIERTTFRALHLKTMIRQR